MQGISKPGFLLSFLHGNLPWFDYSRFQGNLKSNQHLHLGTILTLFEAILRSGVQLQAKRKSYEKDDNAKIYYCTLKTFAKKGYCNDLKAWKKVQLKQYYAF